MSKPSEEQPDWQALRTALIGLGETSSIKSYYPELRRKAAELERFRMLLDEGHDAILLVDARTGRVLDLNRSATRLAASPEAAVPGAHVGDVIPGEVGVRILELGAREGAELRVRGELSGAGDGKVWEFSARRALLDERTYLVIVVRDVTAQANAERVLEDARATLETQVEQRTAELVRTMNELQDASAAKSHFLAAMSHELRTPLNSIIGFSGLMLQGLAGETTDEQVRQLSMISKAGKHLLNLINDLLSLSRIESGEAPVELTEVRVEEIVGHIAEFVATPAREKQLAVDITIDPENMTAVTDPDRVHEILVNLADNAVRHTDIGRIAIRASGDAASVRVSVSDTGPGIETADQERIWDYFSQLGRAESSGLRGTGLGLAISMRLANALGGTIELESEPGSGSIFTLVLPRTGPPRPAAAPAGPVV